MRRAETSWQSEATRRVAALELAPVQAAFEATLRPGDPYHLREATGLEYRRLLLLGLAHPELDVVGGGAVARYARLHAECADLDGVHGSLVGGTQLDPNRLGRLVDGSEAPGALVRGAYECMFTVGDADLWGWEPPLGGPRISAPGLGTSVRSLPPLSDIVREELRSEALSRAGDAVEGHGCAYAIERGCVSGGAGAFSYSEPGPLLWSRHWRGETAEEISRLVGTPVVPTGVFFNYHRAGAASPLHTDPYAAELALLTLLDGPVEQLYLHPELAHTPWDGLVAYAEATNGQPPGGWPHDVGPTPLLLPGQAVPHHRPAAPRREQVVVAAQFFGVLCP